MQNWSLNAPNVFLSVARCRCWRRTAGAICCQAAAAPEPVPGMARLSAYACFLCSSEFLLAAMETNCMHNSFESSLCSLLTNVCQKYYQTLLCNVPVLFIYFFFGLGSFRSNRTIAGPGGVIGPLPKPNRGGRTIRKSSQKPRIIPIQRFGLNSLLHYG